MALNDNNDTARKVHGWEGHFTTIAIAIILASILFTGSTLYSFGNRLTELSVTATYAAKQIEALNTQLKDDRLNRVSRDDFIELRDRVKQLESRK